MKRTLLIFISLFILTFNSFPCTSYLVSKGASVDGSTMITYIGDSHIRYGNLYFKPRSVWSDGTMITIYDRSSNKPLGQIAQAKETYQVIGFMNEYQVSIGETTFGGRSELEDSTGIIDWGSIMFLALQRSKTAREAIKVIAELTAEYGYHSSGESYSIADPNEVWIMEIVGKGIDFKTDKKTKAKYNANKGTVWVAMRVPDGYVCAHANQARITTFPMEDGVKSISSKSMDKINNPSVEVVYAHDVIDFARNKGYFSGSDVDFSFCEAYAPLDFGAARFCELRVWAFYNRICDDMQQYWDYATGKMKSGAMPLFVKPNRKLSYTDLTAAMGDYLQGTELDMSKDVGAGPHGLPYRWRPMTWKYNDKKYFHERVTATQQTAFSWVAQMRNWLPNHIGGLFWYGLDDANHTVHTPFYCGMSSVPHSYAEGNGDILAYSDNAAFWVFNRVSHFSYLFYDRVIVDIRKKQNEYAEKYKSYMPIIDAGA
ncbi:MAG TPA: C69 family dipeptidase, partial [Salinivirgaceae bacterium]|nr:C69 family dipeptidase [Salinivirgaceae bacterium]